MTYEKPVKRRVGTAYETSIRDGQVHRKKHKSELRPADDSDRALGQPVLPDPEQGGGCERKLSYGVHGRGAPD